MQDRLHFKVRLDAEIKQWIQAQAEINRRSMTAEINHILEDAKRKSEPAADEASRA